MDSATRATFTWTTIIVPNLAVVRIVTKVHLESCRALHPYSPLVVKPPCELSRNNVPFGFQRFVDSPEIPSWDAAFYPQDILMYKDIQRSLDQIDRTKQDERIEWNNLYSSLTHSWKINKYCFVQKLKRNNWFSASSRMNKILNRI